MKRHNEGVTIFETLLALTIGMSILLIGLNLYQSFQKNSAIMQLNTNIDTLFQAAVNYYQANCPKGGKLDPANVTGTVKLLNITTDLITPGYLVSTFPTPNPLVNASGPGSGYIVQFNEYTAPRYQQTCSNPPSCTVTTSTQIGTAVIWKIQVAVLMTTTDATLLQDYENYLIADCLSNNTGTGGSVPLCKTNPTGNYLVFERLPSAATSSMTAQLLNSQSSLWMTNPLLKQFNQQYTTNPMSDVTNQGHTTEYQYFYCSG